MRYLPWSKKLITTLQSPNSCVLAWWWGSTEGNRKYTNFTNIHFWNTYAFGRYSWLFHYSLRIDPYKLRKFSKDTDGDYNGLLIVNRYNRRKKSKIADSLMAILMRFRLVILCIFFTFYFYVLSIRLCQRREHGGGHGKQGAQGLTITEPRN